MRTDFNEVKARVSVPAFLQHVGITVSRSNRTKCFIHGGEHENLKIFDTGYYCHTCKAKGSVLDAAMHLWNLNTLQEAAQRLNEEFHLNLCGKRDPEVGRVALKTRIESERNQKRKTEAEAILKEMLENTNAALSDIEPDENKELPAAFFTLLNEKMELQEDMAALEDKEYLSGVSAVIDKYSPDPLTHLPSIYPPPEKRNDQDLGSAFADTFHDILGVIYKHGESFDFLEYTGKVWQYTTAGYYDSLYCQFSNNYETLSMRAPIEDEAVRKWALSLRRNLQKRNIINMGAHLLEMRAEDFDTQPHLLNTPAGVVNLITGEKTPHSPRDRMMKCCAYSPVPLEAGVGKKWFDLLNKFTGGDLEYIKFLQHIFGMILFGKVHDEKIILSIGDGSNGKSTLWNALRRVLGSYATTVNADVLMRTASTTERKRENVEFAGRRFVLAGETQLGDRLSEATVKKLASTDRMTAAQVYQAAFTFEPSHTLVLFTNHLPEFDDHSEGFARRTVVVPSFAKFTEADKQTDFIDRMLEEDGGCILQWAIDGAWMFAKAGYKLPTPPAAVATATEEYKEHNDIVLRFIRQRVSSDDGSFLRNQEAYNMFSAWCHENGETPLRAKEFHTGMKRHRIATGIKQGFPGYKIRIEEREE